MGASVIARLGGGAAHPGNARVRRGEESERPIIGNSLPDLWLMSVRSSRSLAHVTVRSVTSSVPTWLELGVWLARSLLRYAARNFSIEKTVPRDSM